MSGSLGLTVQDVTSYALGALGYPALAVHVPPNQVLGRIQYVLDKLSRKKPNIRYATLGATAGLQNYTPDPSKIGYGIITVGLPRLDPIAPLLLSSGPRLDIFGYKYSYPYRDISELELDYIYFDMATRVLSSEIDWEFLDGDIWIYPAPQDNFQFSYAWASPKILGDDNSQTKGTVGMQDWDWVKEYSAALVKVDEGIILRRFGTTIPGTTAPITTDGASLVQEGLARVKELDTDLEDRTPEWPFVKTGSPADLPLTSGGYNL